jgi:hypothetical protein
MKAFLLFERYGKKEEKISPKAIVIANSEELLAGLFSGSIVEHDSWSSDFYNPELKDDKELHFPDGKMPAGLGRSHGKKPVRMLYIRELPFVQIPKTIERFSPGDESTDF